MAKLQLMLTDDSYARREDSWFDDFDWEGVSLKDIDYARMPKTLLIEPNLLTS